MDQKLDLQMQAMKKVGCTKIFREKVFGGQSGKAGAEANARSDPRQSRNKATLLMELLLEGEAEQLTRKAIEMVSAGDILALRLCLNRLLPPRKDRPIHIELQPVESLAQVSSAISKVVEAIGDGIITPIEGETMANILAVQNDVLTTGDLERRVEQLEQSLSAAKNAQVDQGTADVADILRKADPRVAASGRGAHAIGGEGSRAAGGVVIKYDVKMTPPACFRCARGAHRIVLLLLCRML